MSCHCDACKTVGPLDLDGYCAFCASRCYPSGAIGGRGVRLAMSPESRRELHARAAAASTGAPDPGLPPQFDPRQIAQQTAKEVQRRVVNAAVDAAAPVAEQAIKAAFRLVRKRLGGR